MRLRLRKTCSWPCLLIKLVSVVNSTANEQKETCVLRDREALLLLMQKQNEPGKNGSKIFFEYGERNYAQCGKCQEKPSESRNGETRHNVRKSFPKPKRSTKSAFFLSSRPESIQHIKPCTVPKTTTNGNMANQLYWGNF